MKTFYLYRSIDVTGKSGIGFVAEGVMFFDRYAAVRWRAKNPSTVLWSDWTHGVDVHLHPGTDVVWCDEDWVMPDGVPAVLHSDCEHHRIGGDPMERLGFYSEKDARAAGWKRPEEFVRELNDRLAMEKVPK